MCPPMEIHSVENPGWYILYTRHQHEKAVAGALSRMGIETFLPLYAAVHHWKDRIKNISLPLFPCYVFVRGIFVGQEFQIVSTPGVYGFVRCAGQAAVIPDAEIHAVRVAERSLSIAPHPFLKRGDWVRIRSGPLAGVQGILHRKKNQYRLILSVELLRKSVAVEVDAHAIEPISRHGGARAHHADQASFQ